MPLPERPLGHLALSIDVQTTDLVSGNNTLELLPLNAPMDYPPVVANIDLLLGTSGSVNPSPTPSPTPAPTVAFSANPTSIASGKVSTMTWSSTNATSCTAAGGWSGTKATSGTLVVSPTSTTTYTLTCTGSGGTSPAASTTVAVNAEPGAGQRRVRIGERHDGIVYTFDQPLHRRHGVVRGGLGPVDMELRRFQRRHHRELLCIGVEQGIWHQEGGGSTPPSGGTTPAPVAGNCGMQLGSAVSFCETFDNKNPGIPSRTGELDPNVWGVSRATGNEFWSSVQGWAATTQLETCNGTTTSAPPNDIIICNGQLRQATNDNHGGRRRYVAMYPKQPFDFAGRTGTVSFDVSPTIRRALTRMAGILDEQSPSARTVHSLRFMAWRSQNMVSESVLRAAASAGQYGICPNGNNWISDAGRWIPLS